MTKIRPSGFSLAVFAVLLISGCAGTMSTVGQGANRSDAQMFPMSAEAADKLLATAMTGEFVGSPISRVELPHKGYQTTIRFAVDYHTIVAYMIPAKGRASSGEIVKGYAFEVNHSGTMYFSGIPRAESLFRRIVQDATLVAQPLPLVSFGE